MVYLEENDKNAHVNLILVLIENLSKFGLMLYSSTRNKCKRHLPNCDIFIVSMTNTTVPQLSKCLKSEVIRGIKLIK